MHAYIVSGRSADEWITQTLAEASVSPYDTITVSPDPTSIGIEAMRITRSRLAIHPIAGKGHAVIIRQAHAMTPEAQNAFLKTLEEPPGNSLIILETNQPDAFLPTILSRCQLITLGTTAQYSDEEIQTCMDTLKFFEEVSVGKRLQKIDSVVKTQADALAFVNLAISALHKELEHLNLQRAKFLRNFLTARTQILGNITPKLALDAVFLP